MAAINGVEIQYKDNNEDEEDGEKDKFEDSFSFSRHIKGMK